MEEVYKGRWWVPIGKGKIECRLCPRHCRLGEGQRAFCFVRQNIGGEMVLTTYGRSTGFCVDPIEKKPLNHFYPGTAVLSFGTAGCNLGCRFCQNWSISKAREIEKLSDQASPERIAEVAHQLGCKSVAYTYNDPVIFAEYALDTARACRNLGIKNVAVTAGYISEEARGEFFGAMDAANVDLKAFTETFYHKLCFSHLEPVIRTLKWLKEETDVWFEITNLIIPEENDSEDEIARMCDWIAENLGPDVPLHLSAFHPDFKLMDRPSTTSSTLLRARKMALHRGLHYVYTGNVHDEDSQSTYCPGCGQRVIERDWHQLGAYELQGARCRFCTYELAGRFGTCPGTWGRRRLPVRLSQQV